MVANKWALRSILEMLSNNTYQSPHLVTKEEAYQLETLLLEDQEQKIKQIQFNGRFSNIEVDLNVNNVAGIRNTHLLYYYSKFDERVAPLVLLVKSWAKKHGINNARENTLSSYSLVLMVIHYCNQAFSHQYYHFFNKSFLICLTKIQMSTN
uniref:Poly(A) RNA polymerase mitochondrial-like central palm domain-containing protein n=1 Tax=Ditylenchus dipsaci TaxID=166011 RepID=A0A915EM30_9BILA